MSFANVIYGTEGMQYENSSNKRLLFGTCMVYPDGREFVYTRIGGSDIATGCLCQESVVVSGHTKDLVCAINAIGATTFNLTLQTNGVTAQDYAEGSLFISLEAGQGYFYKIKSHPTAGSTAPLALTLEEGSALRVATTASSEAGLRKHFCDNVLISPTTVTGAIVGVTCRALTATYCGWLQTKGSACCLTQGTVVLGMRVRGSGTTQGAVEPSPGGGGDDVVVGTVQSVATDTEYSLVKLNIG